MHPLLSTTVLPWYAHSVSTTALSRPKLDKTWI